MVSTFGGGSFLGVLLAGWSADAWGNSAQKAHMLRHRVMLTLSRTKKDNSVCCAHCAHRRGYSGCLCQHLHVNRWPDFGWLRGGNDECVADPDRIVCLDRPVSDDTGQYRYDNPNLQQ